MISAGSVPSAVSAAWALPIASGERRVAFAHADAEVFAGDAGLDHLELRAVAHEPFGYRCEFHEGVAAAGRQIVERFLDLVIGIDAHARGAMLGDEFIGDRLAGVALLHADDQTLEVGDAMHAWMAAGIDDEGLAGHHIGRAEIDDLLAAGRDGGARSDAVIAARIETGEDAVEVGALVRHQPPFATELFGNALHQSDVEAGRAVLGHEFERRVGKRRPHFQRRLAFGDARAEHASREQRQRGE